MVSSVFYTSKAYKAIFADIWGLLAIKTLSRSCDLYINLILKEWIYFTWDYKYQSIEIQKWCEFLKQL